MSNEMSKSHNARYRNGDYEHIRGSVLDIGCGPDPIKLPPPHVVRGWDLADGDAQYLATLDDRSFDTVVSAHCLEHMTDVPVALSNWGRVLKDGGYLYVLVPSWTFYERQQWPSRYNADHKASFDLIDPLQRPIYQIIVDKHSGKLDCISAPGKGTEFIIEIPIKLHQQ